MADFNQEYLAAEVALWYQLKCGGPREFLGCHNLTGVSVPRGATTPVYCRTGKNTFEVTRTFRGAPGLGSATLVVPDTVLVALQEIGCAVNLYALHSAEGADEDPTNYDYLYLYEGFEVTGEETDPHSIGRDPGDQTPVMLNLPSSFRKRLKVKKLAAQEVDVSALSTNDFLSVAFADTASCDKMGNFLTLGCRKIFIGTGGATAQILRTLDGGQTWVALTNPFTTPGHGIHKIIASGDLVVGLNRSASEYAVSLNSGTSFAVVTTPTAVQNDVVLVGGVKLWMVGNDGEIWYSSNRGTSVTQQGDGITTQGLNSVSAKNSSTLYAVGNNNTFLRTLNGGQIWSQVTGPAASIFPNDLYKVVAVPGTDVVLVGDEQGNLYRSEDNGDTWETVFASQTDTAGGIRGLTACNCNIITFVANQNDPYFYGDSEGVMYQSVDGGSSWLAVEVPTNTGLRDAICCDINRNWIVGDDGFVAYVAGPTIVQP
jgi:photosystem II stability/assembly factor-like uncharacterized protein